MSLIALMSYLAAKLGGILVIRPEMSWALWPGNVLLVSLLLLVQRRIWPLLVVAGLAAFVLFDFQEGLSLGTTGVLILADTVEVLTAALCLSYAFSGTPELNSVKALVKYSFFAVLLAPFLGAFVGAFATKGDYWTSWWISFFSEALGFLIFLPAILGWVRKIRTRVRRWQAYYFEASMLFALLILVGYFTFVAPVKGMPSAVLYSPLPFLLWSALRFESFGVGTSVLAIAFLSIWGAVHGRGPFIEPGPLKNVFSLQLFLFFTAAPFMVLGALVEERKEAGRALKKSEEKFARAFRQSPMSLTLTSANDHRYIEVNETFEHLTGWSREEVVGRTPFDIGLWVDPSQRMELARRVIAEGSLRNLEHRFRTKNGAVLTGLASAELIEVNGEPCALSGVVDITQRKQAEAALRESEERFRLVANTAPVMIWMSATDKGCDYFNQPWLEFTGRSLDKELGNGWAEGVHAEDLERCLETYTTAFDQRKSFQLEYRLRRYDGEYRWVLDLGVPRWNADGSFAGYIGSCLDVTERKRADEALFTVSRRLIEAHEEERRWIARELHDDINQRLALLAVNLDSLRQNPPDSAAEVRRRIEKEQELLSELSTNVQALSHRLHSSKLEYLGIAAAAASFCKELSARQKVEIEFHSDGVPKNLPEEISLCLFRVLQEALQNATKHSGGRHFEVELQGTTDQAQLTVRDFGKGFDLDETLRGPGLGLTSMNERLKIVNGQLSIETQPQCGTTIIARVPLGSAPKAVRAASAKA